MTLILPPLLAGSALAAQAKPGVARGQDSILRIETQVVIPSDRSLDDARRISEQQALAEATRQVEATVQSSQLGLKKETLGDPVQDLFYQLIRIESEAIIVRRTLLSERVETRSAGRAALPPQVFHATWEVELGRGTGTRDPEFSLTIELNDPDLTYLFHDDVRKDEEVVIAARTSKPSYITLFEIDADTVQLLVPSEGMPQPRVEPGTRFEFPTPQQRRDGGRFQVALPKGRDNVASTIFAVATRQPITFAPVSAPQEGTGRLAQLESVLRWLLTIPKAERATAQTTFFTRRVR